MSASTGQFYLPRRSCTYDSTTRKAHISHVGAPEGAGVVEAVGALVTSVGIGDSVVLSVDSVESHRRAGPTVVSVPRVTGARPGHTEGSWPGAQPLHAKHNLDYHSRRCYLLE